MLMGVLILMSILRMLSFCYMDTKRDEMTLATIIKKTGMKQAELVNERRETFVHLENDKYDPSLNLQWMSLSFQSYR